MEKKPLDETTGQPAVTDRPVEPEQPGQPGQSGQSDTADTADTADLPDFDWTEAARRDRRMGYLMADLMAGESLEQSVARHFGESLKSVEPDATAIAEAEQRGYLKARNELATKEMARMGIWQTPQSAVDNPGDDAAFLSRVRPSVWD